MESIYKVIELIGTSPNSWEEAAKNTIFSLIENNPSIKPSID